MGAVGEGVAIRRPAESSGVEVVGQGLVELGHRARAIKTQGKRVYHPRNREEWLARLPDGGVRFRAETLYAQLDVLGELRPKAKAAMVAEARRDPTWSVLRTIPFLGPVRVALLLATVRTPWRFRTKRNLWSYSGLAVVTYSSSDYTLVDGRAVRRRGRR
jgi:transposase